MQTQIVAKGGGLFGAKAKPAAKKAGTIKKAVGGARKSSGECIRTWSSRIGALGWGAQLGAASPAGPPCWTPAGAQLGRPRHPNNVGAGRAAAAPLARDPAAGAGRRSDSRPWRAHPQLPASFLPAILSTTLTPSPVPPPLPAAGEALWLPNTTRPDWLDGSLPGDRGFDPLGLSKPVEYLQVELDQLEQNAAVNKPGGILGTFTPVMDEVSTDSLQPYSEVFGLLRFRECELIHGRWAMLGALGVLAAEASTGVAWQDAIGLEYAQPQYANFDLPFEINQLAVANSVLMGGVELFRNSQLDTTLRIYPGGFFDPLKLASGESADSLKEAEIKHGRLAMVACFGFLVQALAVGEGAIGSLAKFEAAF